MTELNYNQIGLMGDYNNKDVNWKEQKNFL